MTNSDHRSLTSHLDIAEVADAIQRALHETVFSSGLRISPRGLRDTSQTLARSFFDYYEARDRNVVHAQGETLATDGLSPLSFLTACESLRKVCLEKSNPVVDLPDTASVFATTLALGFMEGRAAALLAQQERIHQAYVRALERGERDGVVEPRAGTLD